MKAHRKLLIILTIFTLIAVSVGLLYYNNENSKVDQRVVPARELYAKYNELAESNNVTRLLQILDSIADIYSQYPHYSQSYEIAVLENNRAAIYITMALYRDSLNNLSLPDSLMSYSADSLLRLAHLHGSKSVEIYLTWKENFRNLNQDSIKKRIEKDFFVGFPDVSEKLKRKALTKRAAEIVTANKEIDRRLSVAYTNLGVVARHLNEYEQAVKHYQTALKLWDKNLDAENNLNILLNQPIKKRTVIEKLFPPERID